MIELLCNEHLLQNLQGLDRVHAIKYIHGVVQKSTILWQVQLQE